MTTFTCLMATLLAVITFPILFLLWATESRHTRIQRLRRNGVTWKVIAARYGVSVSTVRRWATV